MLYYLKKGKNTTETHKKSVCSVGGRCCHGWNVSDWFAKFLDMIDISGKWFSAVGLSFALGEGGVQQQPWPLPTGPQ